MTASSQSGTISPARPDPASTTDVGALVARLREGLSGVTPGPWYSDDIETEGSYGSGEDTSEGFLSYGVRTSAQKHYGEDASICDATNSGVAEVHEEFDEDGTTAWDDIGKRNMAHIANCSPENIASILDALQAAEARADREKARGDEFEREQIVAPAECGPGCDDPECPYSHQPLTLRQAYENSVSRLRTAEAALTACRQKDRADD